MPLNWVIDNYKVNANLSPDEYLLRSIGLRVDLGEKVPTGRKTISGPKRRLILERDGHACQVCGTAANQPFVDEPNRRAILSIGHIIPVQRGGGDENDNLRAECQRCNDEARDLSVDPPTAGQVLARVSNFGLKDKKTLFGWMQVGRQTRTDLQEAFVDWARLPYSQRLEVTAALAGQVLKVTD